MEPYTSFFRFLTGYIKDYNSACDGEKASVLSSFEDAITSARFFNSSIIVRHDLKDGVINNLRMFLPIVEVNGDLNWIMYHYDAEILEYSYYYQGTRHLF